MTRAAETPRVVVGPGAGAVTPEVEARLLAAFPGHELVRLPLDGDVREALGDAGDVVVAGGDGTVGVVVRALAGTQRRIALIPLGTFNNFARSLGIPEDLDAAVEVARSGRPRPVTLGRIEGRPFLEVAAAGAFGELIALGEAARELAFGELGGRIRELGTGLVRPFRYVLAGDLRRTGLARSLVFSNTPTTGAHLVVGDATPDDPYLELALGLVGRRDLVGHVAAALLRRPVRREVNLRFRRVTVSTEPPVPVFADTIEIGRTPVTVAADPGAVIVLEPAGRP